MCSWRPRELITEADAITNGNVAWLTPEKEITKSMQELPFMVLRELLEAGAEVQKDLEATDLEREEGRLASSALLKVRGPWD